MASNDDNNFDKYTVFYAKHAGAKGQYHTKWAEGYIDRCDGKGDEDASWSETYFGTDAQVGLTPAQVRRRAQRRRMAASALVCHIEDEGLKKVLRGVVRRALAANMNHDSWTEERRHCHDSIIYARWK